MKRTLRLFAVVTLLYGSSFAARAEADDDHSCSAATLRGTYGFHEQGIIFAQGLQGGVGIVTLDGNGHYVVTGSFVNQTTGVHHISGTGGTYTVNSDCTGSVVGDNGATYDLSIVDGGNEFYQIPTGGDRVVIWVFKKQVIDRDDQNQGC